MSKMHYPIHMKFKDRQTWCLTSEIRSITVGDIDWAKARIERKLGQISSVLLFPWVQTDLGTHYMMQESPNSAVRK